MEECLIWAEHIYKLHPQKSARLVSIMCAVRVRCQSEACHEWGIYQCSHCNLATYCSRVCQAAHWKDVHKSECQLFRMKEVDAMLLFSTWFKQYMCMQWHDSTAYDACVEFKCCNWQEWIAVMHVEQTCSAVITGSDVRCQVHAFCVIMQRSIRQGDEELVSLLNQVHITPQLTSCDFIHNEEGSTGILVAGHNQNKLLMRVRRVPTRMAGIVLIDVSLDNDNLHDVNIASQVCWPLPVA
jgi:hypothetical protein